MKLSKIFAKRELWKIGIFRFLDLMDVMESSRGELVRTIGESGLRKGLSYQSIVADPFLLVHNEKLYLLYEVKTDHSHGEIWAQSMTVDGVWESHGCVLSEPFHLSYPQVFVYDEKILMVPEAAQSGKVMLYESTNFPYKWEKRLDLVNEPLRDPTVILIENEAILLATTAEYELKIYRTRNLFEGFKQNGLLVTNDKSVSRCAGRILKFGEKLLRPAQDCSETYGKRITFQVIEEISQFLYNERASGLNMDSYERSGIGVMNHHISCTYFNGSYYVSIDARRSDLAINSLILGIIKLFR